MGWFDLVLECLNAETTALGHPDKNTSALIIKINNVKI
jgi:hypothetical protein